MKCLFCEKDTYYEPYSAKTLIDPNCIIYRCLNCRVQFTTNSGGELKHLGFFIKVNGNMYYISQYLPSESTKGKVSIRSSKGKVLDIDFIKNLSPENAERKLKIWLTFS